MQQVHICRLLPPPNWSKDRGVNFQGKRFWFKAMEGLPEELPVPGMDSARERARGGGGMLSLRYWPPT